MSNTVLIVEDEGIVAMEVREYVERLGYAVAGVADSGESALEIAHEQKPDLVIMDIRLKGKMDGIEAAAKMQQVRTVPVIYLTAYSGDDMLERAKVTEPYGYLLKPVEESALRSAIRIAMYKHRRDSEASSALASLSSVLRSLPSGVVVADTSESVVYMNRTAERLLSIKLQSAKGQRISDVVALDGAGLEKDGETSLKDVVAQGASYSLENRRLAGQNSEVSLDLELSPLRRTDGSVSGIICTLFQAPSEEHGRTRRFYTEQVNNADGPLIEEPEQLRDFLEVEIVRLMMDATGSDAPLRHSQEGQIVAYQNMIRLMFGRSTLQEFLDSLPPLPTV